MPKQHQENPPPGAPPWVVTYGDMMSLLLTFFVLIVSFSSTEQVKFKAAISSIQQGLGIWPSNAGLLPTIVLFQNQTEQAQEAAEIVEEVAAYLRETNIVNQVEIYNTPAGIRLIISDPLMFQTGKADIQPKFRSLLNKIAEIIKKREFTEIKVEGHTDNIPIRTDQFPSNWELSAARALNVVKVLAFDGGLDPAKLSGVGYGQYRPRATNNTPEGRSMNRRVEIWIEYREKLESSS
ncbi:MAG: flagellar motor protein MotB [bacterium]